MLKTLIKIKKFGKKLPKGITPAMRRFSGKTITAYPMIVAYKHIEGKKIYYFSPLHLEGANHE